MFLLDGGACLAAAPLLTFYSLVARQVVATTPPHTSTVIWRWPSASVSETNVPVRTSPLLTVGIEMSISNSTPSNVRGCGKVCSVDPEPPGTRTRPRDS